MEKKMLLPADILLPRKNPEKWAVIACDQYTSEPEYWEDVRKIAGDCPSAFNIILPEVWLSDDNSKAIEKINQTMQKYLDGGVFSEHKNTLVYIERTLGDGRVRKGIAGLIDLNDYSFEKGSGTLIRATEATVPERIPPRVKIRRDAPLEMPHVMLLIDDPEKTVIEPLGEKSEEFESLYDFTLMKNGGHIKGFSVSEKAAEQVQSALAALVENSDDKMLFAVGDGNHSLAAAKECYRLNPNERSRCALVEVVNIHDESLEFEPIYRTVTGIDPESVINGFIKFDKNKKNGEDAQKFTCVYGKNERSFSVRPSSKLAVGTLQSYLDRLTEENPAVSVDYIHGEGSVRAISASPDTVGFLFDGMKKDELFDAVKKDGALPRKTFSMGHADDKRFYLECRRL